MPAKNSIANRFYEYRPGFFLPIVNVIFNEREQAVAILLFSERFDGAVGLI